jgi:hypothetical protein
MVAPVGTVLSLAIYLIPASFLLGTALLFSGRRWLPAAAVCFLLAAGHAFTVLQAVQ